MIESIPEEEIRRDKNKKVILARLVITLLFGFILLVWPKMGLDIMFVLVGFFLLILGGVSLFYSLLNRGSQLIQPSQLIQQILQTLFGILLILKPGWMVNIGINLLIVTTGILIITGNLVSILSDRTRRLNDSLLQIIFIIMGIIMIFAPFFTAEILIRILGAMILILSLGDGIKLIKLWKSPMTQS